MCDYKYYLLSSIFIFMNQQIHTVRERDREIGSNISRDQKLFEWFSLWYFYVQFRLNTWDLCWWNSLSIFAAVDYFLLLLLLLVQCSETQYNTYVCIYDAYKLQTHVYTHSKSGKSMFECRSVLLGKITMRNNNKHSIIKLKLQTFWCIKALTLVRPVC